MEARAVVYGGATMNTPPQTDGATVASGMHDEQAAFERWITTEGGYDPVDLQTHQDGTVYVLSSVHEAWEGWRGHAEALAATHAPAMAETQFDMLAHLQRQRDFSERTFGPGARTKGVVDHIRKELVEVEQNPADFSEWADVVILALDGFWRAGATPQQIIDTIVGKQTKNEGRTWSDWRTADPNKAIEHDRTGEACPQCHGKGTMTFHDPEEAWEVPCGICNSDRAAASGGEQG